MRKGLTGHPETRVAYAMRVGGPLRMEGVPKRRIDVGFVQIFGLFFLAESKKNGTFQFIYLWKAFPNASFFIFLAQKNDLLNLNFSGPFSNPNLNFSGPKKIRRRRRALFSW